MCIEKLKHLIIWNGGSDIKLIDEWYAVFTTTKGMKPIRNGMQFLSNACVSIIHRLLDWLKLF